MYAHLVLIKLKPGVTRGDPRVPAWEAKFAALEQQCGGIVRFERGWNTTDRPIAYDFGINMAFATRTDLDASVRIRRIRRSTPDCARSPTGSSATTKLLGVAN